MQSYSQLQVFNLCSRTKVDKNNGSFLSLLEMMGRKTERGEKEEREQGGTLC